MSCGAQIDEVLRYHTRQSSSERRARAVALMSEVALPIRSAARGLSAPAFRRAAPARRHRHRARARAGAADRRRADHRARRDDAGADPQADRRAAAPPWHGGALRHARLRRGRRDRAPRRRAARGPPGRARRQARGAAAAAPRVHPHADRLGAHAQAARPRGARGCPPGARDAGALQDLRRARLAEEKARAAPRRRT